LVDSAHGTFVPVGTRLRGVCARVNRGSAPVLVPTGLRHV